MFCPGCGKQIDDDSKFCGACGTVMNQNAQPDQSYNAGYNQASMQEQAQYQQPVQSYEQPKPKKPIKKAPIILGVILVALIATGIYGAVWYFDSDIIEFKESIEDEDYEDAVELYNDDIVDSWIMKTLTDKTVSSLIDSTLEDFNLGEVDFEDAQELLSNLMYLDDDELAEKAETTLKAIVKINTNLELVEDAEAEYEDGDYYEAIKLFEEVDTDSNDYESVAVKLDEAKTKYKEEILSNTSSSSTVSEYETNIDLVKIALEVLTDDADLLDRQEELEDGYSTLVKSDALDEITDLVSAGDYEDAIELLEDTLKVLTDDNDIIALYDSTVEKYKVYVNETVDDYIDNGKYSLAISFLEGVVDLLPNDTELSDLLQDTIDSEPIQLCTMTITQQSGVSSIESGSTLIDSIGNVYYGSNLYNFNEGAYVTLYLGSEYTTLTLVIATVDSSSNDCTNNFNVVGDDVVLYALSDRSKTTIPKTVEIDVSGVEWITIQTIDCSSSGSINTIISNPLLYK